MRNWWYDWGWVVRWSIVAALLVFGIRACVNSDWYKADLAERAAQERYEATPRVIREFDGCKVYTFKVGEHWQYVTRCASGAARTEWDTTRTEGSGKSQRTVVDHHAIETANVPDSHR